METVVVVAARSSALSLSEMEMLIGSAVVLAVLVWMVLTRARRGHDEREA